MKNEFGLDSRYFREQLEVIARDADRYTPAEMNRALTRLASVAGKKHEDLMIVRRAGNMHPEGIRDRTGFLIFFREVHRYEGQQERYDNEVSELELLASDLLEALELR